MKFKQLTTLLAIVSVLVSCAMADTLGGLDNEKAVNDDLRQIVKNAHKQIEQTANEEYKSIEPVSYRGQVVNGYNYFIKATATSNDGKVSHIHMRIHRSFKDELKVFAVKKDQDQNNPIEYF